MSIWMVFEDESQLLLSWNSSNTISNMWPSFPLKKAISVIQHWPLVLAGWALRRDWSHTGLGARELICARSCARSPLLLPGHLCKVSRAAQSTCRKRQSSVPRELTLSAEGFLGNECPLLGISLQDRDLHSLSPLWMALPHSSFLASWSPDFQAATVQESDLNRRPSPLPCTGQAADHWRCPWLSWPSWPTPEGTGVEQPLIPPTWHRCAVTAYL